MNAPIIVTGILDASTTSTEDFELLTRHAKAIEWLRKDIWQRFGGKAFMKIPFGDIRKRTTRLYANLSNIGFSNIDGTVRNESVKDILNDIKTYKEAAFEKIKRKVSARLEYEGIPKKDRRRELSKRMELIRSGNYEQNSFLHRIVRKCFKHGQGHAANQFVVRSDKHTEEIRSINGKNVLWRSYEMTGITYHNHSTCLCA